MNRPIGETVLYQAPTIGAADAHGNAKTTYAAAVPVGVYAFDPGSTSEPRTAGHDRVIVEPTIYFPPETVFAPHGRVTARGLLYEVEGETREWRHPSGTFLGNVVTLRRVTG